MSRGAAASIPVVKPGRPVARRRCLAISAFAVSTSGSALLLAANSRFCNGPRFVNPFCVIQSPDRALSLAVLGPVRDRRWLVHERRVLRAITPTRRSGAHAVDDLGAAKALDAVAIFAHRPSARGHWQIAECRVIFELIRLRCSAGSVTAAASAATNWFVRWRAMADLGRASRVRRPRLSKRGSSAIFWKPPTRAARRRCWLARVLANISLGSRAGLMSALRPRADFERDVDSARQRGDRMARRALETVTQNESHSDAGQTNARPPA